MGDEAAKRIGDTERDEAVSLLQEHMAAGRLDSAEFDERMSKALAARTDQDLLPLFDDLPGRRPGSEMALAAEPAAVPAPPERNRAAVRIGQAAIASLWPIALILNFAFGWHLWWLMLVPVFFTPVLIKLFGLGDRDEHTHRLHHRRDDRNGRGEISNP